MQIHAANILCSHARIICIGEKTSQRNYSHARIYIFMEKKAAYVYSPTSIRYTFARKQTYIGKLIHGYPYRETSSTRPSFIQFSHDAPIRYIPRTIAM